MIKIINPTHIYKGRRVRLVSLTYFAYGQQYCTIEMINDDWRHQLQTVQLRNLKPLKAKTSKSKELIK